MTEFGRAFQEILAIFGRLEIPYFIGGSVASGSHGLPRQTNDIDIIADINIALVPALCEEVSESFYADPEEIRRAIGQGRSFNLIHLKSILKFDIFPVGENRFTRSELSRRRYTNAAIPGLEDIEFPVASVEDTILSKLVWFRKGGGAASKQWQDIQNVLRIQAGRLDHAYLTRWATELGIADLLANVFESTGS